MNERSRGYSRREMLLGAVTASGIGILSPFAHALSRPFSTGGLNSYDRPSASKEKSRVRIEPFPLHKVRLSAGPFADAQNINHQYLLSVPRDRLLHMFRVTAGLASSAQPLGGWERPDCELRGHFAGGHFLSACALMYSSTGDEVLKERANAMVSELWRCQAAHKNGYLSAFPEEEFDRLRDGQKVWAPFYTIHKIMAGHLDVFEHCGNEQALQVAEGMASWVARWVDPLSEEHMQRVLEVEHGGMLEVLCNLYGATGKERYLELSRRFDHKAFFDPLAEFRDELKGLHANTNIPKIIGVARRYEITGDQRDHDIASYFWEEVTSKRTFCTGGTSNDEHWESTPGDLSHELSQTSEECCCGYNMLKLTRHILGWNSDPRAMDYYERTLYNSRLGTQDFEGMKSYFLPLEGGYWKYYNSRFDSFWCCTGTGAEEFAKFGDSIFFHDDRDIYVNLFVVSEVNWPERKVRVEQQTSFPAKEETTFMIQADQPIEMGLNLRIPQWVAGGGGVRLNGTPLPVFASPGSYLSLNRVWKNGDRVDLHLPMGVRMEALPGDATRLAAMYGPLVLAGRLGSQGLSKDAMHVGYNTTPGGQRGTAPSISIKPSDAMTWIERTPDAGLRFHTVNQSDEISLIPFYQIQGERYAVYWKTNSEKMRS